MVEARRAHDRALLDALESIVPESYSGEVWRIARRGRDALRGSSASGRWSPGREFEVLYTSIERQGALDEIGYRLSLEPIWPSRIEHDIHRIATRTRRSLRFADIASLAPLGVDPARNPSFDYSASQAIASAAHFLEFDGLIVPSARSACANLVIFLERMAEDCLLVLRESAAVDWDTWRKPRR